MSVMSPHSIQRSTSDLVSCDIPSTAYYLVHHANNFQHASPMTTAEELPSSLPPSVIISGRELKDATSFFRGVAPSHNSH